MPLPVGLPGLGHNSHRFPRGRAQVTRVERLGADHLRVAVAALPHEGQANEALVTVLAEYFDVPRSRVRILPLDPIKDLSADAPKKKGRQLDSPSKFCFLDLLLRFVNLRHNLICKCVSLVIHSFIFIVFGAKNSV